MLVSVEERDYISLLTINLDDPNQLLNEIRQLKKDYSQEPLANVAQRKKLGEECKHKLRLLTFIQSFSHEVLDLNSLISVFNGLPHQLISRKIDLLNAIENFRKELIHKYHASCIITYPSCVKMLYETLYSEILNQRQRLIPSFTIYEDIREEEEIKAGLPSPFFADILKNLSPLSLEKMIYILSKGKKINEAKLQKLFNNIEDVPLTKDKIVFLRGSNSHNFKLIESNTGHPYVLKLDHRFNNPRELEMKLRQGPLKDNFVKIHAERERIYFDETSFKNYTLSVTEFCSLGSVADHAKRENANKLQDALNIFQQMTNILIKMQEEGCLFLDMKNANWLIDDKFKLVIADTKSFSPILDHGMYDINDPKHRFYDVVSTAILNPPELSRKFQPHAVDSLYSYMLGKNIYQYLIGCLLSEMPKEHDAELYNFNNPIFLTPVGNQFSALIKKLIRPIPADRLPLHEALGELQSIAINAQNDSSRDIFSEQQRLPSIPHVQFHALYREGLPMELVDKAASPGW